MRYQDKVAIVTGGANGIGRCIVEHFVAEGAYVAVIDMDKTAGCALQQQFGDRVLFFTGDVAKHSELDAFVETVLKRFPTVHVLINNACKSRKGLLSQCSYEDFLYVQQVGVVAPYYLTQLLEKAFAPEASIINISSTRDSQSQADSESYAAAKGGIAALTHALSVSLAGRVRVNSISPGWIDTGMYHEAASLDAYAAADISQHPAGRVGRPEDIASLALFLCSSQAGFIDGENIVVDGGMSKLMVYHDDKGWIYQP